MSNIEPLFNEITSLIEISDINRRDRKAGFQAGGSVIDTTVANYNKLGVPLSKMNVGFPMYAKFFPLADRDCAKAKGCALQRMESSIGADLGNSGAYTFNLALNTLSNATLKAIIDASFRTALANPIHDSSAMTDYYIDHTNGYYWTWVGPDSIQSATKSALAKVGGVMVWSIGQDDTSFSHFKAIANGFAS